MTRELTMQSICGFLADPAGIVHRCKVSKADLSAAGCDARLPQPRSAVPANAFDAGSISNGPLGVGAVLVPVGQTKIAPPVVGPVAVDMVNVCRGLLARHPGPYNSMRKIPASEQVDESVAARAMSACLSAGAHPTARLLDPIQQARIGIVPQVFPNRLWVDRASRFHERDSTMKEVVAEAKR